MARLESQTVMPTFVPRNGLDRDEPEPLFDHIARVLHRARNRHLVLLERK